MMLKVNVKEGLDPISKGSPGENLVHSTTWSHLLQMWNFYFTLIASGVAEKKRLSKLVNAQLRP